MLKPLIALVLILLASYGLFKAAPLLRGPSLVIDSPQDYASLSSGTLAISGTASRVATLAVNGAPLLRDEEGKFASTLDFPKGTSVLSFVATDQFGRRISSTRSIFVPN